MDTKDKKDYLPEPISSLVPNFIEKGEGALVYDKSGESWIDLSGGWGAQAVGYSHPDVVEAVKNQSDKFFHTDFSAVPYESYLDLAKELSELAPGKSDKKAAFFNSGAEAVENAVKIAKAHTGGNAIVVFENAFHGRTLLTMTMTHKSKPYKSGFGPFAPDIYRLPYPNEYRRDLEIESLERKLKNLVDPTEVAAMVIEPVIGEGGFLVPPDNFLPYLRKLADQYGFDLIFDEIQSGIGRTGKFLACEHFDVEPDLITVGKALAGGLPLSGVIGKSNIMDAPQAGGIGGTYVGNPVAIESSLAILEVIEKENLLERAKKIGETVLSRFNNMKDKYQIIGDVRGLGAMDAIELVKDRRSKEPAPEATERIVELGLEEGVILPTAGLYENVIRLLTPLVIEETNLEKGLDKLEEALAKVDR